MNNNNQLVLDLCRFLDYGQTRIENAFHNDVDLPIVLGQLLFHRVGGIAYDILKSAQILPTVNREFQNVLASIYKSNYQRTESYQSALADISEIFRNAGFPYAFLKGAYLASLYPKGYRTSNDFDVLVNQEDITKVSGLLKSNGFMQGFLRNDSFQEASRQEIIYARINKGETVPFVKEVNLPSMKYMELDINFSLDFKAIQETDTVKEFLEHAQSSIKTTKGNLFTLSNEDFLIHLCAHLYKEATVYNWVQMGRDLSLYKFCDLYLFIHKYFNSVYVQRLAGAILRYGLQRECYYALYYTRILFSIQNESLNWLLNTIHPNDLSFLKQIYNPENKEIYFYKMDFSDWIFCGNRINQLQKSREVSA